MGYGYDVDVEIAFADDDDVDDDAIGVIVAVVHDDCANELHAVVYVAFLRFSLRVRPTNFHRVMDDKIVAMKSDCRQPMMDTFRPLIVIVKPCCRVANSYQLVHCSMWDLVCLL